MRTRETSREAYRQLVDSGQLMGRQAIALQAVIEHGPATSGEIIQKIDGDNVNLWRARFTELQARGLIVETAQRKCAVTGRTALVWDYSGRTKALDLVRGNGAKKLRALLGEALKLLGSPGPRGLEPTVTRLREEAKAAGVRL